MLAVGVDVALARGLDVVLLDGERRVVDRPLRKQTPEDLRRLLATRRPDVVAIDSPPAFGMSGSMRRCERQLLKLGVHSHPTPSDPEKVKRDFFGWMRVGAEAFAAACEAGYPLFRGGEQVRGFALEVFPHGTAVALKGALPPSGTSKSTARKRRWRAAILEREGVATSDLRSLDEVDAALAALTGLLVLEGRFWIVGDPDEGVIVLPGTAPSGRYQREVEASDGSPSTESTVDASSPKMDATRAPSPVSGERRKRPDRGTTTPGYVNRNRQTVIRRTDIPGNDHDQWVYVLRCGACGHEYGANGSDVWLRRCPKCQKGQPGLRTR